MLYWGGKGVRGLNDQGKQVVLFGGTFDPPHIGHLTMAQLALEQTSADEVWFLPAPIPPHKHLSVPHLSLRKQMVEQLIVGYERFHLCLIEEQLPKPSYTVDTVAAILRQWPNDRFQFLIGSDSLAQLPTWREADRLTRAISFLVAARTGYPFAQARHDALLSLPHLQAASLAMPLLDVSSTWLRERFTTGKPTCGLCPEAITNLWLAQETDDSSTTDTL